jgi:hypothetical protein
MIASNNDNRIGSSSGIYERAVAARRQRERQLSTQRDQNLRQECTFTPSRTKTGSTTAKTPPRTQVKSAAATSTTGTGCGASRSEEPGYRRPTRAAMDRYRDIHSRRTGGHASSVAGTLRNQTVRPAETLTRTPTSATTAIQRTPAPSSRPPGTTEYGFHHPEEDEIPRVNIFNRPLPRTAVDLPKQRNRQTYGANSVIGTRRPRDPTIQPADLLRTPTKPMTAQPAQARSADRTTATSSGSCRSSPKEKPTSSVVRRSSAAAPAVSTTVDIGRHRREAIPSRRTSASTTAGGASSSAVVVSQRIEDLYRQQVTKMRLKPKTLSEERVYRDALYDQRELDYCTFQPQVRTHPTHRSHHHGDRKQEEENPPESSVVEPPAFQFTRTPRRLHLCELNRVTGPFRFSATTEPTDRQPQSMLPPTEIVFEVDQLQVDLISIMHPFEPHHCRPRLLDLDDELTMGTLETMTTLEATEKSFELAQAMDQLRSKPGKAKRRPRSRRRRIEQDAEPEYGSI